MTRSGTPVNSYRDIIAWQKGMDLVCRVYDETGNLPPEERFGLAVQMRRAAVSIPSNISEGLGRSTAECLRFLHMARGSAHELSTQAEICRRLGYAVDWAAIIEFAEEVGRVLNGLISALERSASRRGR